MVCSSLSVPTHLGFPYPHLHQDNYAHNHSALASKCLFGNSLFVLELPILRQPTRRTTPDPHIVVQDQVGTKTTSRRSTSAGKNFQMIMHHYINALALQAPPVMREDSVSN